MGGGLQFYFMLLSVAHKLFILNTLEIILLCIVMSKMLKQGFPGGAVVENLPANAGDTGSSPGLGRSHMPRSN